MDHRRQKPRVTSPVQVPSVTCDLAAINVEDLAGDVGDDSGAWRAGFRGRRVQDGGVGGGGGEV